MRKKDFEMPKGLCSRTEAYINDVLKYLKDSGRYSSIDNGSLTILARQYDVFLCTSEAVSVEGTMVYNEKEQLVVNPKISVMNQAEVMCIKVMKEYGLMALSRKSLGTEEAVQASPLAKFFDEK